ncbi:DUF1134 domain-containing protein [Glacieibacterium megasporae]|uniref:DUF1134 domain-containing protein n=1 Tax=Glacieibacterium megasporae TaxID=2835787 RepID=UPI001C1E0E42|nr:DUF1134 domain-containing protein [Polymorphobacter megasporae]UAJ11449.1 EipA family protein [Polymorphobacter megasporae]
MRITLALAAILCAVPALAQEQPPATPDAALVPQTETPQPPSAQSVHPATPPVDPGFAHPPADTYEEGDVIAAAEGAFGKGAEGAAKLIEKAFKDLGRPNGYIVGREASGAFFIGLRYGSGTLYSKVEGEQPVHWTGPSVGFDVGGDGDRVFTLIYHLDDTNDLFRRYPAAEGKAYLIGGFTATYNQRDNVILVPIKLGVGWRLGVNAGWVNYTRSSRLLPF